MLPGKQGTPAQGSPAGAVRWPVARLPPSSFFLVSAVFHYLGPSLAVLLFLRVPVLGMAWLRIASAAVVFALWRRPWRLIPRLDRAQRTVLVQLGVVLAAMNSLFYLALARLPLATVGAIEFLGTVLLAASAARSRRNVLALALTTIGVAAITDVRLAGQPLGFLYAFGNCVLFMCYVILGHRIATPRTASVGHTRATAVGGIDLLAASMLIAAVVVTPAGLGGALQAFGHPVLLLAAAGVGVCSSVIPYVTDQLAMARLPRASFALMLALLPMFATVIGALILRQFPTRQDLLGIGLVIIGVAVHKMPGPTTNEENTLMRYTRLGSSGLNVSRICLGMMSYGTTAERPWHLSEDAAEPIVARAVEAGVMFFDTADTYSDGVTEEITGRLLSKLFRHRDDYVLATKVYFPMGPGPNDRGLSRKHVLASIDASLRRLGTDYVDIYQIHRWDYGTPIEETMAALHDVVRAGKARYIGASSMYAWQFAKAQHVAEACGGTRFSSMQNHYNLVYREEEREMLPLCQDQGVGVIPWSPLARGLLAGSRTRGGPGQHQTVRSGSDPLADEMYADEDFDVVDVVRALAAERGVSPAQIALAWLLRQPAVTAPIVGATRLAHLDDAIAAADVTLDDAETARLEAPYRPHRILGHS